jgi:hypothetical protein
MSWTVESPSSGRGPVVLLARLSGRIAFDLSLHLAEELLTGFTCLSPSFHESLAQHHCERTEGLDRDRIMKSLLSAIS